MWGGGLWQKHTWTWKKALCSNASHDHARGMHATALRRYPRCLRRPPDHWLFGDCLDALQDVQLTGAVLAIPATEQEHPAAVELIRVHCGERGIGAAARGVAQAVSRRPSLALATELP